MNAESRRSGPAVQVLAKAAALLDRLAEEPEAGAGRLAELLDEPRSSVYRLLASLQELELVEPGSERGSYRLGLKVFRLGTAVISRFDERQAALPLLERIHEETEETVFLCVRRAAEAVCIERLDGRRVQSLALRLGGSLPLHAGAGPRALLAFEPRDAWHEYVRGRDLERYTRTTPATADELLEELEATRLRGYALSDGDVTPGIAALGAPVFDHHCRVIAALSISGVREAILGDTEDRNRELITNAAREVSHTLGFDEEATRVAAGGGTS